MARLFNKKHTQTLLYKGIVERSFSLKNGYIEPIIGLILLVFSLQANNTASSITFSLCFPLTQAYIIKVGHKQSVLNDTVFFEFSFCMKLCNFSRHFTCIFQDTICSFVWSALSTINSAAVCPCTA